MSKFSKDYERAEKYIKNKKGGSKTKNNETTRIQRFIQNALIPYIKNLQKNNPSLGIEEFKLLLDVSSFNLSKTVFKSSDALDYYMEYIICEYLEKNPMLLQKLSDQFDINKLDYYRKKFQSSTNLSFSDYLIRFMYNSTQDYQNALANFEETLEANPNLKYSLNCGVKSKELDAYIKSIKNPLKRSNIKTCINYYTNGLFAFLPEYKLLIQKDLKDTLIASITEIATNLNNLNLFEKYNDIENSNYQKLGISDLATAGQKFDLTNPELLKDLSIYELMILDSFWINRYAKELENYCSGIMCIYGFDLLPKILNNTLTNSDTKKENIEEVLKKCSMLKFYSQEFMSNMHYKFVEDKLEKIDYSCPMEDIYRKFILGELKENQYFVSDDQKFIVYSFEAFAKSMKRKYGEEYDNFFNFLPGKTKIEDDAMLYGRLFSPVANIYSTKDEILNCLVYHLDMDKNPEKSQNLINAGIIPNSKSKKGTNIFLDPNSICLGIDSKLTFPVTAHMKLSVLKDFFHTLHNSKDIFVPLYEGHNDFTYKNGDFIATQQIFPTSKEFEATVRKLSKNSIPPNNLVDHLYWLIQPKKVPEKYKASEVNPKTGKTKKIFYRRYINLSEHKLNQPFQIYVLKDDKYIPVQESGLTFPDIDCIVPEREDKEIEF